MTDASLSAKVTADIADFNQKFGDMRKTIDAMSSGVNQSVGGATKSINEMEASVGRIGKILNAGVLVGIGTGLTNAITMPMIGLAKEAVATADGFKRSHMAFTTMLGSAEQATAFIKQLQEIAVTTPFEFTQLQDASKRLLAMGIAAERIPKMITTIGDAVAGLGSGKTGFDRITLAIGQMNAKGRTSAEEMKQLTEAGIGAWDALAQHLNVTVAQAMDMVQKRQVDSATTITAVMAGMGQRFGGLMDQQSSTIEGRLSNLRDVSTMILGEIGAELITVLRLPEALEAVGDFAQGFLAWFKQLDAGTKQLLLVFTGAFAMGGPILVVVGGFMAAMAVVTAPLLVGGAIIAGLVAGVTLVLLNWQKIKDTGTAIWTSASHTIVGTMQRMTDGVGAAIDKLHSILDGVQAKTEAVKGFFRNLYQAVVGGSYIPDMVDGIRRHMEQLDVAMVAPARNATVHTGRIIEGAALTWQGVINQFVSTVNFGWGSVTQTVGSSLARMTSETVNWATVGIQIGQQLLGNMINLGLQLLTQWTLTQLAMTTATVAGDSARTASAVIAAAIQGQANVVASATTVSAWAGAQASIMGMLAATTGAVKAFFVKTLFPAIVAVGKFIIGVLTAIAKGMAATIFGIPVALAITVAVVGLVAALAATKNIPGFAKGGISFGPAVFGEAGPEAAIPLNARGAAFMQKAFGVGADAGGRTREIHTHVYLNGREIARAVADDLPSALRQSGVPI